jgi:hypothetical protein
VLAELPISAQHSALTRYLSRLKASSRRTQQVALDQIAALLTDGRSTAADLSWHRVTEQEAQTVWHELAARYAPATANRMIAALRGVLKEAWRLGLMDAESYHRASALHNVPWSTPPRGRTLSDDELRALFDACSQDQSPLERAMRRSSPSCMVLGWDGPRRPHSTFVTTTPPVAQWPSGVPRMTESGRCTRSVVQPRCSIAGSPSEGQRLDHCFCQSTRQGKS